MAGSFKVLIVDQFSSYTPYSLRQNPVPFDTLCEQALAAASKPGPYVLRVPTEVREVTEDFWPEMCTTVIRADAAGLATAWLMRWDSSG